MSDAIYHRGTITVGGHKFTDCLFWDGDISGLSDHGLREVEAFSLDKQDDLLVKVREEIARRLEAAN